MRKQITKIIFLIIAIIFTNNVYAITENSSLQYNIEMSIPEEYKTLYPGENLWITTKISNLENKDRINITLKYSIFNYSENEISSKTETTSVQKQASFVGDMTLPPNIEPGVYIIEISVLSNGSEINSSRNEISVIGRKDAETIFRQYGLWIIILLVIVTVILLWSKIMPGAKKSIKKFKINKKIDMIIKGKIVAGHIKKEDLEQSRIPIKSKVKQFAVPTPQKNTVPTSPENTKPKDDELIF